MKSAFEIMASDKMQKKLPRNVADVLREKCQDVVAAEEFIGDVSDWTFLCGGCGTTAEIDSITLKVLQPPICIPCNMVMAIVEKRLIVKVSA
jgi:hypothetical protein